MSAPPPVPLPVPVPVPVPTAAVDASSPPQAFAIGTVDGTSSAAAAADVAAAASVTGQESSSIVTDPCAYIHPDDTVDYKRSFALTYHARKKPKTLFAMALGFPEFQGILDRPPLSTIKRKELNDQFIPKAEDFKQEVKRRSYFFMHVPEEVTFYKERLNRPHPLRTKRSSIVLPQPNQWLNTQLKNWLMERPLKPNDDDVKFIRYQVKRALEYISDDGTDTDILHELPIIATPSDADVGPSIMMMLSSPSAGGEGGDDTNNDKNGGGGDSASHDGAISSVLDAHGKPLATTNGGSGTDVNAGSTSSYLPIDQFTSSIETDKHVYQSVGDNFEYKRSAAKTFLLKGSKPRFLFALAMGMPEYSELLQTTAFTIIKKKDFMEDFMPRADDYRYEIKRRSHFFMNVEHEEQYYTQELKLKSPLENMRGIVSMPQPNQWKLQALKLWLSERPLKPNPNDTEFLKSAIKKCLDSLKAAVSKDAVPRRTSSVLMNMVDPSIGTMGSSISTGAGGASLAQVLQKQDAILSTLNRHTKQQALLNKITILTQTSMRYQHELASLRSTGNEIESRIIDVEMKLAETTVQASQENLKAIITKQETKMEEVKVQIHNVESKIESVEATIKEHQNELEGLFSQSTPEDEAAGSTPTNEMNQKPIAMGAATTTAAAEIVMNQQEEGTEGSMAKKPRYSQNSVDV